MGQRRRGRVNCRAFLAVLRHCEAAELRFSNDFTFRQQHEQSFTKSDIFVDRRGVDVCQRGRPCCDLDRLWN